LVAAIGEPSGSRVKPFLNGLASTGVEAKPVEESHHGADRTGGRHRPHDRDGREHRWKRRTRRAGPRHVSRARRVFEVDPRISGFRPEEKEDTMRVFVNRSKRRAQQSPRPSVDRRRAWSDRYAQLAGRPSASSAGLRAIPVGVGGSAPPTRHLRLPTDRSCIRLDRRAIRTA